MGLIIPNNASGATKVYCVSQTSLPDLKSIHTEYLSKHFSTKRLRTFVEKAQKEAKVPITCPPRTDWFSRVSHSVGNGPSFRERSRLEKNPLKQTKPGTPRRQKDEHRGSESSGPCSRPPGSRRGRWTPTPAPAPAPAPWWVSVASVH